MRRLVSVPLVVLGLLLGSPSFATAGLYLGSFENPPNGQDGPDAAIIAAILAAVPSLSIADLGGVTRIYKNDIDDKSGNFNHVESGIAAGAFSVNYTDTDKFNGGIVQDVSPIIIGGDVYEALFYTVKVNGPNAGFKLYAWDSSVSSNDFTNVFYKDSSNGLNYSYDDGGVTKTNSWSVNTGTTVNLGVSHVSVWAKPLQGPDPGPSPVPEPGTLAVWGLLALCGLGYGRRELSFRRK